MPTVKIKSAFAKVVKGSTIKKAMQEVGYAQSTSLRTNKLTRTKGWNELMEKFLPDKLIAKRHTELLNKREIIKQFNGEGKMIDQPDTQAVSKGLDMAYKIKGRYVNEKDEPTRPINLIIPIQVSQSFNINGTHNEAGGSHPEQTEIQSA